MNEVVVSLSLYGTVDGCNTVKNNRHSKLYMGLISLIPLHGFVYKAICKNEEGNCLQGWIKFQCEIWNFLFNLYSFLYHELTTFLYSMWYCCVLIIAFFSFFSFLYVGRFSDPTILSSPTIPSSPKIVSYIPSTNQFINLKLRTFSLQSTTFETLWKNFLCTKDIFL